MRPLLLVLLAVGCSAPFPPAEPATRALCVSPDVPDVADVLRAVDAWNAATVDFALTPVVADECDGVRVTLGACDDPAWSACAVGQIWDAAPEIHVQQPGRAAGKMYGVILHELGHVFGAAHHDGGFMAPEYTAAWEGAACVPADVAADVLAVSGIETISCR